MRASFLARPFRPRSWAIAAGVIAAAGPWSARAARPQSNPGPVIELPAFTVTDSRLLPPPESWRYAQVPGFEVLSSASDRTTENMIHDFLLFHRAVEAIWPTIRMHASVAASLVLCHRSDRFAEFVPADLVRRADKTFSLSLQDREDAAFVVNLSTPDPSDAGALSDYSTRLLHDEYVHFVIGRIGPRTPEWLRAALAEMFRTLVYRGDEVGLPAVSDPNTAARKAFASALGSGSADREALSALAKDKAFAAALAAGTFMPLDRLFSTDSSTTDASGEIGEGTDSPWARESYEFVHLCLFGFQQRYRPAFLKFAFLAAREPLTEDLFRRCFNLGYRDMLARLWGYADFAAPMGFSLRGQDGKPVPEIPALALREATDAESARIKGEAQRMAGRADDARHSLIAPYLRGSRDPELLASLGLVEDTAGRDERARRFLEAASTAGTARARAYLELARLRLNEARSHPATSDGRLGAEQLAGVLKPLFTARARPPSLPEVYETIAEAWSHASIQPTPGHLGVVDEGVTLFPYDTELVYDDAKLQLQSIRPERDLIERHCRDVVRHLSDTCVEG